MCWESTSVQRSFANFSEKISFEIDAKIRINVSIAKSKLHLNNVPVEITGVYANIFQIEETTDRTSRRHTLQYTDVLTHNIEILDL